MANDSDARRPAEVRGDDAENVAAQTRTERGRMRVEEDRRFVPVIIKRNDEARRHPDDTLQIAIGEGLEQLKRPTASLFLSAMAAGLALGWTVLAVAVVTELVLELQAWNPDALGGSMVGRVARALVYPLGFLVSVMSGTQLFTEHTATAVYPVLDRKVSLLRLLRLWAVVLAGNLAGAGLMAAMLWLGEGVIGARAGYAEIGRHLVEPGTGTLFVSAVLAGALMAVAAWLIAATTSSISQIASIYVVTFLIGLGGLHHSIAGSVEMFAALWAGDFSVAQAARFVVVAVAGNAVGGVVLVAVLNYGHIRESQAE